MMAVFGLNTSEIQAGYDEASTHPFDSERDNAPGFFEGAGTALPTGFARAGAELALPFADEEQAGRLLASQKLDPATNGWLAQALYGLGSAFTPAVIGTLAAGGNPIGGALALGETKGYAKMQELRAEGVDEATAAVAGTVEGIAQGVGVIAPAAAGTRLATKVASGAGINVGLGAGQRAATGKILADNGYAAMAKQYEAIDGMAILTDAVLGSFFGALHAKDAAREPLPSEVDAALAANNTRNLEIDSAPGIPADTATRNAHVAAADRATGQLLAGERVDVAGEFDSPERQRAVANYGTVERAIAAYRETAEAMRSAGDDAAALAWERNADGLEGGGFLPRQAVGDPPVPEGMTRLYHGGNGPIEDSRWFTSDRRYAEGYAEKSGGDVHYVDLPDDHPLIAPEYADQSIARGYTWAGELPSDLATRAKSLSARKSEATFHGTVEEAMREHGLQDVMTPEQAAETLAPRPPEPTAADAIAAKVAGMTDEQRALRGEMLDRKMEAGIITPKEIVERDVLKEPRTSAAPAGGSRLKLVQEDGADSLFYVLDEAGRDIGAITTRIRDGNTTIIRAAAGDESVRGKGHFSAAYRELADRELASGKELHSDRDVSADASMLYESLKKRGYKVVEGDDVSVDAGGYRQSNNKQPVYRVVEGTAKAEGETARRQQPADPEIAAARAIAAERPDLDVTLDDGTTAKAADALTKADEEIARAEQDAGLFEAAINCFLRYGDA